MATANPKTGEDSAQNLKLVHPSERLYGDVLAFLIEEAAALDEDRHWDWHKMLAEDIVYKMPVRETLYRSVGRGIDPLNGHFDDGHRTLTLRVKRSMDVLAAYDREPPPRFRRSVSNLRLYETDTAGEYVAKSYLVCHRNRFSDMQTGVLSGSRDDILRRTPDGLKLARRLILIDQVLMDSNFLNVFM